MDQPSPARAVAFWLRQPRWVHSLVSVVIAMFLIGLAVMIAVPALIIGAGVVGLFFLAMGVRSLILRFKEGPKADTMRENVRVVVRQEP